MKQPVKHPADIISCSASVAPDISTKKDLVDEIMRNLEHNSPDQPLR